MKSGAPTKKRAAYRKGWLAEYAAALFLISKGYRVEAMRYRTKGGEIDIIARKGQLVIFVEVKARHDLQTAVDAVSHQARQRIAAAASQWLSKQTDFAALSTRFDIIAVRPLRLPQHFRDAF